MSLLKKKKKMILIKNKKSAFMKKMSKARSGRLRLNDMLQGNIMYMNIKARVHDSGYI